MSDRTLVETLERDGCRVEIHTDEDAMSPREFCNVGLMYCWHPDYKLGDEQFTRDDHDSMEDVVEYLFGERGATVVIPLFLLDHSGLSIRSGRPLTERPTKDDVAAVGRFVGDEAGWDTTMVGYVCDTPKGREETGVPEGKIIEALRAEVDEYDKYLRGDVYGIVGFDAEGEETEDNCWGFIGWEYALGEANSALDGIVAQQAKENRERAYWLAREVVTKS